MSTNYTTSYSGYSTSAQPAAAGSYTTGSTYGTTGTYGTTAGTTYGTTGTTYGTAGTTYGTTGTTYSTTPAATYSTGATTYGTTSYGTTGTYGTTAAYTTTPAYGTTSYGVTAGSYAGYGSYAQPAAQAQTSVADYAKQGKQLFQSAFGKSSTKVSAQELINQLRGTGKKYEDQEFPAELNSLTGGLSDEEIQQGGNDLNMRSLVWLRPDQFWGPGQYQLFTGDIDPNDIQQGQLGDCYFLSTLAAIAERPERIRKLFEPQTINEVGVYGVKVCDEGQWKTIIVDDLFPCSDSENQPVFSRSSQKELWVLLLEKAWAKIYGSYVRIEGGLTRECLHDLTGAPTKFFSTSDPEQYEQIWKELALAEQKNFIMTAGSGDLGETSDLMTASGLVASHAYSLLSAVEVTDRNGRQVRLVKLRNPWGKGEWKGEWSDESEEWTPELKAKLNVEDKDDGEFYMKFDDVLKYYSDLQICKCHDDYKYEALDATSNAKNGNYFRLTVPTAGHHYITVNQESSRKHPESENYKYSEVTLVLGKKDGENYDYVEGIQKPDKEVWTDGHLEAGEYIVYAKVAWRDQQPKKFSLSAYGPSSVHIEEIQHGYAQGFIEKVYMSKGRTSEKLKPYSQHGVENCFKALEVTDDGFGYIYYRNESEQTLEEDVYFKSFDGLKLRKPYRGSNFKIQVPAGSEGIVITKVLPYTDGIGLSMATQTRFT